MDVTHLKDVAAQHLALAREASSGRHAITLMGDHATDLRQTLIALAAGHRLHEHESPGEATLVVLSGEATFEVAEDSVPLTEGDYFIIPPARHGVTAVTDLVVLLTVATRADS